MRPDETFLTDIVDAADAISGFLSGVSRDAFLGDDLLRSAILHKLTVIGEAAGRLSAQLKAAHPQIPWRDVAAFRNVVVHAYFNVDWGIVWDTAVEEVPALRSQVAAIMK